MKQYLSLATFLILLWGLFSSCQNVYKTEVLSMNLKAIRNVEKSIHSIKKKSDKTPEVTNTKEKKESAEVKVLKSVKKTSLRKEIKIQEIESNEIKKITKTKIKITIRDIQKKYIFGISNINNKPLINHNGFHVESAHIKISWADYFEKNNHNGNLANLTNDKHQVKKVSRLIQQSINLKESSIELKDPTSKEALNSFVNDEEDLAHLIEKKPQIYNKKKISIGDEIVFFEYTDKQKKSDKEMNTQEIVNEENLMMTTQIRKSQNISTVSKKKLSSYVKSVINREINNNGKKSIETKKAPTNLLALLNSQTKVDKVTTHSSGKNKRNTNVPSKEQLTEEIAPTESGFLATENIDHSVVTSIRAIHAGGEYSGDMVADFEFIPDFDKSIKLEDYSTGNINLGINLKDSNSMIKGTLIRRDYIRTKIDLPLDLKEKEFVIPLMTYSSLEKIIDENDLEGYGSFVLTELQENVEDVEIQEGYEYRIFLDEDLNISKKDEAFRYILFLGVPSGNVLIKYLTTKGMIAERLTHVVPDELYFDIGYINNSNLTTLEIFEENTMGKVFKELNISVNEIKYFNQNVKISQEGLGKFELNQPPVPMGMRRYIELNHLTDSIFVGYDENEKIFAPSLDFVKNVLAYSNIEKLERECIIQINFDEQPLNVTLDGDSVNGPIGYDLKYLGLDGLFYDEVNTGVKNAFIVGQNQGSFNIKVEYENNRASYFQSFCAEGTYLVEQL